MTSYIYEGWVRHRRSAPTRHAFRYRVMMLYLELGAVDAAFAGSRLFASERAAPASFRRRDHLGDPDQPLDDAVRDLVHERVGRRPTGPIRLLTHPRYFGYVMNPVSLYYCFDGADDTVDTIVAEVHNTPWGERHSYVLDARAQPDLKFAFRKDFHVSPFMDMDMDYEWSFTAPDRRLAVHMINLEAGAPMFDATMVLERRAMTPASLRRALLRYPLMTARVVGAIYWQALRLRLKGTPFYDHPDGDRDANVHHPA